ncbi:zinc finger CCCH-type antiviral protein 1-like [Athene cunicularia]|uniref:zinc finger CCCH-type antiviral protein 1-like n=1 Tax=Athene cunicularia TaxID=194338 RepID=UPI000EF68770|nr:zinc finger CCCH-type antiviral protein 1-like [Athene cunicularia]
MRSCKYSHDIFSPENKKVLKAHELSGLDENELRVLLLQNDPFLLPDTCQFYNRKDDICIQQIHCNKLHICRHFLQGECRFSLCKKSHDLLDGHSLRVLETGGIGGSIASNIQTIYDHRHEEFKKELKKGKIHNYKPRENLWKKTADTRVKEQCGVGPTLHVPLLEGPGSNIPGQNQYRLPTGAESKDQAKEDDAFARASKNNKEDKSDEICVFYIWRYCKHKDKCKFVHYHLPYRWQIYNGVNWNDVSMMEEIEKAYCDPKNIRVADKNIDFQRMTCSSSSLRRLSTASSVSKPTLSFTTQWIWYWKNNQGQWVEYGEQGEGNSTKSPSSAVIENLYLADPDAIVPFQAGFYSYELNFKEMTQTNISSKTRRPVCRRPKFVSAEDVQKIKRGLYAVELSNVTSEYNKIKQLFQETMKNYKVLKIQRIQNPSLWKVFQWQKEQMKRENGGKEVNEKLLFHGTKKSFVEAICIHNFDWRICGSNGTNYGKGSYFARDASYSHRYCQPEVRTNIMFVARVLVGEYVKGCTTYVRPPAKSTDGLRFYDSCVDNELNPSIFVVFEKYQIYPEYIIQYKEENEKCTLS